MKKRLWIEELANILLTEYDPDKTTTREQAIDYASCLWPSPADLRDTWDGTLPSPRAALDADRMYWED